RDARGYDRARRGGVTGGRGGVARGDGEAERLLTTDVKAAQMTLAVDVQSQLSVEQRNVNADRSALSRIEEAAGGACLAGTYADVLAAGVPRLNYQTERVEQVGLFTAPDERYASLSHWVFLAAFVVLASAEWM